MPPIFVTGHPDVDFCPAVSNSSVEMRRGGKWWIETLRLGIWRVAHLRAGCAALSFVSTGLTGQWTGLTGGWLGQVAPVWLVRRTGLTGGVRTEPVK